VDDVASTSLPPCLVAVVVEAAFTSWLHWTLANAAAEVDVVGIRRDVSA
jgi:hypothetical protein